MFLTVSTNTLYFRVWLNMFVFISVPAKGKLYNVDEALLCTMEEKYRIVSDELEQLEKESQSVSMHQYAVIVLLRLLLCVLLTTPRGFGVTRLKSNS